MFIGDCIHGQLILTLLILGIRKDSSMFLINLRILFALGIPHFLPAEGYLLHVVQQSMIW